MPFEAGSASESVVSQPSARFSPANTPLAAPTPVRILALETSETAGSLAALDDERLLGQVVLDTRRRSAQTLAAGLQTLWKEIPWQPRDVQLVAVTAGPGSFTGLRVGVTTAKILAYAVGAELLGVDTLEVLAQAVPAEVAQVAVAVDAQRGQVVGQAFRRQGSGWFEPLDEQRLVDFSAWLTALPPDMAVAGPLFRKLAPDASQQTPGLSGRDCFAAAATAEWVGRVAWRHYQAGQRGDPWTLLPHYSRLAAAEEKWRQRNVES